MTNFLKRHVELFVAMIVVLYTGANQLSNTAPKHVQEEEIADPQRFILTE